MSGSYHPGDIYWFPAGPEGFGPARKIPETTPPTTERGASAASFADWDGDGDLDMLVGNIGGQVYWIANEGTRTAFKFGARRRLLAGGKAFVVGGGDAHPVATDWDRDGTPDLLVGCGDGAVLFHKGERQSASGPPTLQEGIKLQAGGKPVALGMRVKLFVHDWNEDGHPDLLAGNFGMEPRPAQPTPGARPGYFGHVYVLLRQPQ